MAHSKQCTVYRDIPNSFVQLHSPPLCDVPQFMPTIPLTEITDIFEWDFYSEYLCPMANKSLWLFHMLPFNFPSLVLAAFFMQGGWLYLHILPTDGSQIANIPAKALSRVPKLLQKQFSQRGDRELLFNESRVSAGGWWKFCGRTVAMMVAQHKCT